MKKKEKSIAQILQAKLTLHEKGDSSSSQWRGKSGFRGQTRGRKVNFYGRGRGRGRRSFFNKEEEVHLIMRKKFLNNKELKSQLQNTRG